VLDVVGRAGWLVPVTRLDGYEIRTVQELLGHNDLSTTMNGTYVVHRGARGVRGNADQLPDD
jgi:hypothetical protein